MRRVGRGGFTLLEIIVVLAVLGMGMAIIGAMMRSSARYSERVEEETAVQLACDNLMSSILSGNMTATLGIELPIPDAPNWTTKVELLDGPLDNIVAVRITAQRYDVQRSLDASGAVLETRTPISDRTYVVKEWARRADVHTRVVSTAADGTTTAVDGTGETVMNDLNAQQGQGGSLLGGDMFGGDMTGAQNSGSLFDDLDASFNMGGSGVGGGLGGGGVGGGLGNDIGPGGGMFGGQTPNGGFGGGF